MLCRRSWQNKMLLEYEQIFPGWFYNHLTLRKGKWAHNLVFSTHKHPIWFPHSSYLEDVTHLLTPAMSAPLVSNHSGISSLALQVPSLSCLFSSSSTYLIWDVNGWHLAPPLRTDQDKSILGQIPRSSTTITDAKTFVFGYPCQNMSPCTVWFAGPQSRYRCVVYCKHCKNLIWPNYPNINTISRLFVVIPTWKKLRYPWTSPQISINSSKVKESFRIR